MTSNDPKRNSNDLKKTSKNTKEIGKKVKPKNSLRRGDPSDNPTQGSAPSEQAFSST